MEKKRDYFAELRQVEYAICDEFEQEMKRIGRTLSREDDNPLEFFGYSTTENISAIHSDGTMDFNGIDEPVSFRSAIANNDVDIFDAASLIKELREMGRVKIREIKK